METVDRSNAKNALMIGTLCSLTYLGVYFARNILSAVSPQMIDGGIFTTELIGSLSSLFFMSYAVGQLINGAIGDRIKAKYMISIGLLLAGLCCYMFTLVYGNISIIKVVYAAVGFGLSMVYAPMVKTVAENTEPDYATRCSLGFTFASFFGSPVAGFAASFLLWQSVFYASSAVLIIMGTIVFTVFFAFEKRGVIKYRTYSRDLHQKRGIAVLIKHRIIKFTFISIITGVVRTTVVFWMPTYISQRLGFSAVASAKIFTIASLAISVTPFIAVFIYEKLKRNMDLTLFLAFGSAVVWFIPVFFIEYPMLNIIFLILAIMSSNSAGTMLWSRYCPSLRDTGMVSTATGYLDFMSYMAASVSSTLFANAVSVIGWKNLILIWMLLMLLGMLICIPINRKTADI